MARSNRPALPQAATASPEPFHAFADHFDYVCRTLRRFGVAHTHVEDVAQDVFVIVCRRWTDYRPELPLRPWLAGIAFHRARRHLSRVWRETPSDHVDLQDETAPPDERLFSERARALAIRCLASLAPRDRAVLSLHDIEGVPVREVAEQLSVPIFTIYTRLRRARLRFARRVEEVQAASARSGEKSPGHNPLRALLPVLPWNRRTEDAAEAVRCRPPAPLVPAGHPLAVRAAPPPPLWKVAAVSGASAAAAFALFVTLIHRPAVPWAATPSDADHLALPGGAGRQGRGAPLVASRGPQGGILLALSPASPAPAPAGASLTEGLAGYWRFDEGHGFAKSRDLSPGGRDCSLRDVDPERAWIEGSLGGAVDVGKGWIECPRPALPVGPDTALSVSAWVRMESVPPRLTAIVSRQFGDGAHDYFFLGMVRRQLRVRSSVWRIRIDGPELPAGRWVHIAFTHDASGTRLYQDGVEVGVDRRNHQTRTVVLATPIVIGASINGPGELRGERMRGAIDEVMVHDRALSPAEVAALAAGEQPPSAR